VVTEPASAGATPAPTPQDVRADPAPATAYAVGWPAIDQLHAECDACLAALERASPAEQADALALLFSHLLDHFGAEEALMQASEYPRFDCHKREHDAVLRVVARVRPLCEAGDHDIPVRLATEFPQWFGVHANTMDVALAAWLREQSAAPDSSA
jgi:hemerythrin-like metal-binding protein